MLLKRIKCLICDLGLIYLLYYLFGFINPFDFPFVNFFFCFVGIYFLITFFMLKRSLFQYLFQIEIPQKQLRYMLFKVLFLSLIPWVLSHKAGYGSLPFIAVVLLAVNILSIIVRKKSVWEWCAKTRVEVSKPVRYAKIISQIALGLVAAVFVGNAVQYGYFVIKEQSSIAFPLFHTPAPVSCVRVHQYAEDIKKNRMSPEDYVLQLFENHDIVLLYERTHPEYTQWQLFSRIILNDTFASKVGNLATEYGRVMHQPDIDSLLNRKFSSETERQKAVAFLMRENSSLWPLSMNTNIYDFAVHLSQFNETREADKKIRWFFTDVGQWGNIHTQQQWSNNYHGYRDRDSLMAMHTIAVFDTLKRQNPHFKLLVIQNTSHATKGDPTRSDNITTADYLYKEYGDRIAFVWLNNHPEALWNLREYPAQAGLLDAAAERLNDTAWAVSFSESILGEAHREFLSFDLMFLKMKEMFNGMIYYQHPQKQNLMHGFPYLFDNFQDTLLKRNKIVFGEKEGEEITRDEFIQYGSGERTVRILPYFLIYNAIYYLFQLFILSWLAGCLIAILKRERKGQL